MGEKSERAELSQGLLAKGALKSDIDLLFTGSREAEQLSCSQIHTSRCGSPSFNELDSYALAGDMNSREIIEGVSFDPRIGDHYNNPSFGYGAIACLKIQSSCSRIMMRCLRISFVQSSMQTRQERFLGDAI